MSIKGGGVIGLQFAKVFRNDANPSNWRDKKHLYFFVECPQNKAFLHPFSIKYTLF